MKVPPYGLKFSLDCGSTIPDLSMIDVFCQCIIYYENQQI